MSGPNGPPPAIHASTVAWQDRACLIRGGSGAGKSALALNLIALGCVLVADDQTVLRIDGSHVIASPPPTISGLIEARGAGLIRMPFQQCVPVVLVVDLDHHSSERMPPQRTCDLQGISCPVIFGRDLQGLPATIFAVLRYGLEDSNNT